MGSKWGRFTSDGDLRVVLYVSRNKDNEGVEGFEPRRESYITKKTNEQIKEDFKQFIVKGKDGEFSRCYVSVNVRDENKVRVGLMHELIDENIDVTRIQSKLASIAADKKCSKENKWLFDYDDKEEKLLEFVNDVKMSAIKPNNKGEVHAILIETHKTPNGYAVIVDRGFDTRELLDKWENVSLKRDDLLCIDWGRHKND